MNEIDAYLKNVTPTQKEALSHIRAKVKQLVPQVTEAMSYGIPTFKLHGKNMIHFAAFKDHMSLFPGAGPIAELEDKLTGYKTAKGTVQFTEDNLIPDELLEKVVLAAQARVAK